MPMGRSIGLYPTANVTLYPVFVKFPRSPSGNATPADAPIWKGFEENCALAVADAAVSVTAARVVRINLFTVISVVVNGAPVTLPVGSSRSHVIFFLPHRQGFAAAPARSTLSTSSRSSSLRFQSAAAAFALT